MEKTVKQKKGEVEVEKTVKQKKNRKDKKIKIKEQGKNRIIKSQPDLAVDALHIAMLKRIRIVLVFFCLRQLICWNPKIFRVGQTTPIMLRSSHFITTVLEID